MGTFSFIGPLFPLVWWKNFHWIALPNILFLSMPSLTSARERSLKHMLEFWSCFCQKHFSNFKSHCDTCDPTYPPNYQLCPKLPQTAHHIWHIAVPDMEQKLYKVITIILLLLFQSIFMISPPLTSAALQTNVRRQPWWYDHNHWVILWASHHWDSWLFSIQFCAWSS